MFGQYGTVTVRSPVVPVEVYIFMWYSGPPSVHSSVESDTNRHWMRRPASIVIVYLPPLLVGFNHECVIHERIGRRPRRQLVVRHFGNSNSPGSTLSHQGPLKSTFPIALSFHGVMIVSIPVRVDT